MPTTTFLSRKPIHPDREIQGMLEELSSITGETWCAERYTVVPERAGFLGMFKRAPIYGARLYKSLSRDDNNLNFQVNGEHTHLGEVQHICAVVNDHDLCNYLFGALGQLTDHRNAIAWFEGTDLLESLYDKDARIKRFFIEACELAQACGMEQGECRDVLNKVFASNPSSIEREIHGVFFTLNALCAAHRLSLVAVHNKHIGNDLTPGAMQAYVQDHLKDANTIANAIDKTDMRGLS